MKIKFIISLLTILLWCNVLLGQEKFIYSDSILMFLKNSKIPDTSKILKKLEIVLTARFAQTNSGISEAQKILIETKKNKFLKGSAEAYKILGILHFSVNSYSQSISYFDSSLVLYNKLEDYKKGVLIITNIGTCYMYIGNLSKALSYHFEALKVAERINDNYALIVIYNNIATVFSKLHNSQKALEYYIKSTQINTSKKGQFLMTYLNIGNIFKEKGELDSAEVYFKKLLFIAGKENNPVFETIGLEGLAEIYKLKKKYEKSIDYYNQILKINDDNYKTNAIALNGLGESFYLSGEINISAQKFERALLYAEKINYLPVIKSSSYYLSLICDTLRKYDISLYYYKKFMKAKDSLINEQNNKIIAELEATYQFEKQENEIELLSKETMLKESELVYNKTIRNFLLFMILLIIVIVIVLYRNFLLKKRANDLLVAINKNIENQKEELKRANEILEKENVLAQFEILKNQVNPHFLFNSLNTISALINTEKDKAQAFILDFSKIFRSTLEIKDKLLVELSEELELVNSYLSLQKMRFGNNLVVEFDLNLNKNNYEIPPFALQLMVENAIKHNIISNEFPLKIEIFAENNFLVIRNNIQARPENVASTGIGQKNLISRYYLLTNKEPEFYIEKKMYIAKIPLLIIS